MLARPSSRLALLLLAILLAPVAFRSVSIADRTSGLAIGDLRGLESDLATSLLVLALVLLVGRLSRSAAALLVGLLALGHYANLEVIRELGSLASVLDAEFLAQGTFLAGSAAAIASPGLLAVVSIASLTLAWLGLERATPWRAFPAAIAGALLIAAQQLWPFTDEVAFWRQTNVLQQNVAYALQAKLQTRDGARQFADPATAMLDLFPDLAADLSGTSFLPDAGRARNVLLIVIESLSGGHVADLAADHGFATPHQLPALDALARRSISYSSFFTNQRKTNRGMYSILCGELPNLLPGTPKMTQHAVGDGWRRCLPEVLRSAGFATAYLQAAPLAFMLKDQFMPRAGFDLVRGYDDFDRGYVRTHWGVDDRALYEQSLPLIDSLQRGGQPWFLTLLTVTTHHPYTVPADFELQRGFPHARALAYADRAIGEYLRRLAERGVLEDTLVLITSDESMGQAARVRSDGLTKILAESWGLLIALTPDQQVRRVAEASSQMDLAISILDYLGIPEAGSHFFGRSVFRDYLDGRFLFFANTNHFTTGVVDPFRRLSICRALEGECRKYRAPGGRLFGAERQEIPWVEAEDGIVREMAARSIRTRPSEPRRRDYELVQKREIIIEPSSKKILHGGQYVDLGPGEWMEVELELEAHGQDGFVRIDHYTTQTNTWAVKRNPEGLRPIVTKKVELRDGQTLHWKYAISPAEPMKGLQSRSTVRSRSTAPFELIVKTARMSVRWAGKRPAQRVRTDIFEVAPSS